MKKYKEITRSNYKFYLGDLIVFANDKTRLIDKLVNDSECSLVTFNWKGQQNYKDYEHFRYFDNAEAVDLNYIENKCKDLVEKETFVAVLIDDTDGKFAVDKDFGKKLKGIAEEINRIIIVETELKGAIKNTYPTLKDVTNQELVRNADIVIFNEYDIVAKNKYGKTGIVNFEESEN